MYLREVRIVLDRLLQQILRLGDVSETPFQLHRLHEHLVAASRIRHTGSLDTK